MVKKVKEKPIILITNDDDISSPGIRALVDAVKDLGRVVVVAPDKPQSGMGHAITIGFPLRMRKMDLFGASIVEQQPRSGAWFALQQGSAVPRRRAVECGSSAVRSLGVHPSTR